MGVLGSVSAIMTALRVDGDDITSGRRHITHFVSYSSVNERRVRALLGVRDPGFLDECFLAPQTLSVGDPFPEDIERAISGCEAFHLFWSAAAAGSAWVAREVELAFARWRQLDEPRGFFRCYRLDHADPPPEVKSRFHVLDLSGAFDARRPDQVYVSRLPHTGADCFGRNAHLDRLDAALDRSDVHAISFVAFGGQGKSTLVNRWNARLARDGYRGIRRVYAWSFYSGGASEGHQVSADQFIAHALRWFGGESEDPTRGTAWDKGERLAGYVRREPTLLILDGLEPLQNPPGPDVGRLRDPGLATLLREIAADNLGLCVLTSRLPLTDLDEYLGPEGTHAAIDLEALAPVAGVELLRARGVRGDAKELDIAVADFGGHALALSLLGCYLAEFHDGDVRRRAEIATLTEETERGGHARRVMASYERMFADGPELTVLLYLGFFDRPASPEAVAALQAPPSLLGSVDPRRWKRALHRLRQGGLVTRDIGPGAQFDTHPLVREHFGSRLKKRFPDAWTEGHRRLYEYFRSAAPELPNTLAQMEPLFAAMVHGAAAGRHQEVNDEILWRRILHEERFFLSKHLGAYPAYLDCLAPLFSEPWRQTVQSLRPSDQGWLLNQAGYILRALGRPREAIEPMEAALDSKVNAGDEINAARAATNLSEVHAVLGDFRRAEARAREAIEHSDRSHDKFLEIAVRGQLGYVLLVRGNFADAQALFEDAELRQRTWQPSYPFLYSVAGYFYCDLILEQGDAPTVARRASQILEWSIPQGLLLTVALTHLSLGRANLAQGERAPANEHFDRAVEGLRAAGQLDYLPRGLLARAAFRRAGGDLVSARRDLNEAMKLIERSGFRVFAADCALEEARIAVVESEHPGIDAAAAQIKLAGARESFLRARTLIAGMGYGRRQPELAELARALGEADAMGGHA